MKKDHKSSGKQEFHKNLDVRIEEQNDSDLEEDVSNLE